MDPQVPIPAAEEVTLVRTWSDLPQSGKEKQLSPSPSCVDELRALLEHHSMATVGQSASPP